MFPFYSIFVLYKVKNNFELMKQIIKYTIWAMLLVVVVVACDSTSKKEDARERRSKAPNAIVWDTLVIKNAQPLDVRDIKASCSIELHYIVPKEYEDAAVLAKIQYALNALMIGDDVEIADDLSIYDVMVKYAAEYVADYNTEVKKQAALWHKVNGKGAYAYFSYDKKIETFVLYNEVDIVSYQVRVTELKGDNTSTVIVKNLVLDLNTGDVVKQDEIFDQAAEDKLNRLLIQQAVLDHQVESVEELQNLGYWGIADLEVNDNFYVDKDGITYTYSPAEYSDEKLGVFNVSVHYDSIIGLVKPNSPIAILVHNLDSPTTDSITQTK